MKHNIALQKGLIQEYFHSYQHLNKLLIEISYNPNLHLFILINRGINNNLDT